MKLSDFLRDRIVSVSAAVVGLALLLLFMYTYRVPSELLGAAVILFLITLTVAELWEFFRRRSFYDKLTSQLEQLDQKYLITEMLDEPQFLDGRIFKSVMEEVNKSMCDNVAEFRRTDADFREFIEMWVHEVKLPVASLQLMAHNHRDEFGEKAQDQLRRIDSYTDQVLYYVRSENAEKDYLITEVSLKKIFSNTAMRNREDLLMRGAELSAHDLGYSVMTDGKWLEYMLGQLIANSIKYAHEDRTLTIEVWAEKNGSGTMLHFRDNGIGIPASDIHDVFRKSFTGENGRSRSKSTGMGLYIVKSLCQRLGHKVEVSSVQGEWTEFIFTFADNELMNVV